MVLEYCPWYISSYEIQTTDLFTRVGLDKKMNYLERRTKGTRKKERDFTNKMPVPKIIKRIPITNDLSQFPCINRFAFSFSLIYRCSEQPWAIKS